MTNKEALFEAMCDIAIEEGQEKAWTTIVYDLWPLVKRVANGENFYELERQVEST